MQDKLNAELLKKQHSQIQTPLWDERLLRERVITSLFEEDSPYLMNTTDNILLTLKFDLIQKYSVSKRLKSQYC